MIDLYATLGLKKTATTKQIRTAYRKLSKIYHPDMPKGDATAFQKIKQAHDVLTDDEQREHYDRTGEIKPTTSIENESALVANILAEMLAAALQHTHRVEHQDIVGAMRQLLEVRINQFASERDKHMREHTKMSAARKRLKCRGDDDMIGRTLEWMIKSADELMARIDTQHKLHLKARDMLKTYSYDFEKVNYAHNYSL